MNLFIKYFILAFFGCFFTILVTLIGYNEVIASSIVSIIISIYTITIQDQNKLSWAAFTGSFAGMTFYKYLYLDISEYSILNYIVGFILLSTIVSLFYSLSEYISEKTKKNFFDGYGGRLGTIAFFSVIVFIIIKLFFFYQPTDLINIENYKNLFDYKFYFVIVSSIIASMISMEIKNAVSSLNDNYKVLIVAITGIIGGILLYKIPVYGKDLSFAWYTGAFVGMSSYFVLMLKRHYFFSGFISGILYIATYGLMVGFGGKLGFISFLSVLMMSLGSKIYSNILSANNVIEKLKSGEDVANVNVNDDYAQKLIETLLKAKEKGDLNDLNLQTSGINNENFVIGEKEDYGKYIESITSSIPNFDKLDNKTRDAIYYFINIGLKKFIYFREINQYFVGISYYGIDNETRKKMFFSKNSNFIKVLEREKRIISFSKIGMNQSIFLNRFSKYELNNIEFLIIIPIIQSNVMTGFFFVLEDNKDIRVIENNIILLKNFYSLSNKHLSNKQI